MRSEHVVSLFAIAYISLVCCGPDAADVGQPAKLLIEHARLIDGSGGPPAENVSILISAGTIVRIGQQIVDPEAKKLDASGLTVLPGIVDSHVHVSSVPGSGFRDDSPEPLEALQRHHLRAYLACGVTTVLDTAIPVDEARRIQGWLQAGHPGPRLLVLSPTFTSPRGYLSDNRLGPLLFFSPVSSIPEVHRKFRESDELDAVGVKVVLESGFGTGQLPIHGAEIREAIREEARRRNLPLYIHSTAESDHRVAVEMGAYAHVHGATFGSDGIVKRLEQTSHLITTLSIQDAWTIAKDPSRLNEPLYQSAVPQIELETARSQNAWMNLSRRFAKTVLPETAAEEQIADFAKASDPSTALAAWLANVRKLHAAGATIVMGSDSGNWPIMPHMFHGPTSLREIELLGVAGLSPMEAIRAATSVPAAMLGLDDEIGTVAVGRRADLVMVREDPLENLRGLRSIQWTIKDGVAKSPNEWLAARN